LGLAVKRDKPQKGNPHGLSIKQHVFPAQSIKRFTTVGGTVSVRHLATNKLLRLLPEDQLFCAKRVWDQRAEHGYMRKIENEFQDLAKRIVGGLGSIKPIEFNTVTNFFALWYLRAQWKNQPLPPQPVEGVLGEDLTKDQEEILEKKGVVFIRHDQTIHGRSILGGKIQIGIDRIAVRLAGAHWGIFKAIDGEFIVPDTFARSAIVPVTPNICLVCGKENSMISKPEVAAINRLASAAAIDYSIARDFAECPL
jgi:hypothetical protein